jgi:hypothetical protein
MINKSKSIVIAAVMTIAIASPAFAQSREHEGGSVPNYYDATGQQIWGSWSPPAAAAPAVRRRNHMYDYAPNSVRNALGHKEKLRIR